MYYDKLVLPVKNHEVEVLYYKAKSNHRPVIFEMHGGGFMFGSATNDAILCHRLRNELDVNVVSIEYTSSIKAPYPTQLNEVYEVMDYFFTNKEEYQIDPTKFITLGHSAGANLATTVCLKANKIGKFKVLLQILDYPYLDLITPSDQKPMLPGSIGAKFMEMFRMKYSPDQDFDNPLISPIKMSPNDLEQMPPAVFVLAQNDSLKYEALDYARLLSEQFVEVHMKVVKYVTHAFMEKYFSASREIKTKYLEEQTFIWMKAHIQYYIDRDF